MRCSGCYSCYSSYSCYYFLGVSLRNAAVLDGTPQMFGWRSGESSDGILGSSRIGGSGAWWGYTRKDLAASMSLLVLACVD